MSPECSLSAWLKRLYDFAVSCANIEQHRVVDSGLESGWPSPRMTWSAVWSEVLDQCGLVTVSASFHTTQDFSTYFRQSRAPVYAVLLLHFIYVMRPAVCAPTGGGWPNDRSFAPR